MGRMESWPHNLSRCRPHAIADNKGLFTSTDPNSRRVKPENVDGRVQVKLVYVVLEAQYQSALTQTVKKINRENKQVACRARMRKT